MQKSPIVFARRYRALLWCLALSLAFHFLIVPLLVSLFGVRRDMQTAQLTYEVRQSSALRISRRTQPRPASVPHPQVVHEPHTAARPQQQQRQAVQPPKEQRREVARIEPHATIHVPRISSQSVNFGQQQALFEKTIAQLRRESDPVLSAAKAQAPVPSAPKRYAVDFSGSFGTPHAEGVLTPVKSWRDGPYDYYYVQYSVQYADGSTETGYVPWPIRYLPQVDPFLQHWEHFPLPVPLHDFKLPPGTDLHPLVAFCLEHRSELSDCPIEHD